MKDIFSLSIAAAMETSSEAYEALKDPVESAAHLALSCVNREGRLCFICSQQTQPFANLAIQNLMRSKANLRPPLPALLVSAAVIEDSSLQTESTLSAFLEWRSIANPSDCALFVIDNCLSQTVNAIDEFSQEHNLSVISVLQSEDGQALSKIQRSQQVMQNHAVIPIFVPSIARKQELTLFILNCLGAMIEQSLFGTVIES